MTSCFCKKVAVLMLGGIFFIPLGFVLADSPPTINVEFRDNCVSHNYKECFYNNVYWYDSCGRREDRATDCGPDTWTENYQCDGSWLQREKRERGCAYHSCYDYSQWENYTDCADEGKVCKRGKCASSCQCEEGICCDECDYKDDSEICDSSVEAQYGCPWGSACGVDLAKRTRSKFRYCSGKSSKCSGEWGDWQGWSDWGVVDYCTTSEVCRPGNTQCEYNSACVKPSPSAPVSNYIKYYKKACYSNELYWFDSNGVASAINQKCSDDNECTIDSCKNSRCLNLLRCDGDTCAIGSADYCELCEPCGDGQCNCEETPCSCREDCPFPNSRPNNPEAKQEEGTSTDQKLRENEMASASFSGLRAITKKWYGWPLLIIIGLVAIFAVFYLIQRMGRT